MPKRVRTVQFKDFPKNPLQRRISAQTDEGKPLFKKRDRIPSKLSNDQNNYCMLITKIILFNNFK